MRLVSLGAFGSSCALALALAGQGCGDDGSTRGGDAGGTRDDAGGPASPTGDGGGGADTGAAPRDAGGPGDAASGTDTGAGGDSGTTAMTGQCTNDADLAVIESTDLEQIAEDCGTECFFGGDDCVADCIEDDSDLSTACAGCFAIPVDCTIENCVPSPCGPGTGDSEGCRECRCGQSGGPNCIDMFVQCSGLPSDDCSM